MAKEVWKLNNNYRTPNWTLNQLLDRIVMKENIDSHLNIHLCMRYGMEHHYGAGVEIILKCILMFGTLR